MVRIIALDAGDRRTVEGTGVVDREQSWDDSVQPWILGASSWPVRRLGTARHGWKWINSRMLWMPAIAAPRLINMLIFAQLLRWSALRSARDPTGIRRSLPVLDLPAGPHETRLPRRG